MRGTASPSVSVCPLLSTCVSASPRPSHLSFPVVSPRPTLPVGSHPSGGELNASARENQPRAPPSAPVTCLLPVPWPTPPIH